MKNVLESVIEKEHKGPFEFTAKEMKSGADVRWCAGCGDFSVLAQVQRVMPTLGVPKEKLVVISGIGCSSRFPYYMATYGMHTMHGRALPIASGLKIARPDLSVWVATGDGDCMSIGGNHFIHTARRNVDMNVLMFNNGIYSLTKGQYSPLSLQGQITKSSPLGVLDDPFNASALALGSGSGFVARSFDKDPKNMKAILERAAKHKGFAFVEIYSNCVIFNDGAYDEYTSKTSRMERTVNLEHGQPLIFGKEKELGIKLDGFKPTVVSITDGKHSADDLLVHDELDTTLAAILADMTYNHDVPQPMGVFHAVERPTYDTKTTEQLAHYAKQPGAGDMQELLKGNDSWEIK
ncbi:MAG: 2-oxoacid:ferredoxin oxidoreductase subunit beta [Chlorobi bacterium]|nr:2-oxoacid:ferredoxin oxidoreductase subunit beta [Chlorobiota bacterium]